jgi:hypothetical protein
MVTQSDHPVRLVLSDDLERSRFTVFFRAIFVIPLFIWLALWTILAWLISIVNWLCTLVMGRSPGLFHRFLASYVKFTTQVYAYLHLAADPYPTFDAQDGYPVDLQIGPPARQGRLSVALRLVFLLPAALVTGPLIGDPSSGYLLGRGNSGINFGLLWLAALLGWFAIMATSRMPRGLRDAAVYALLYGAQFWAYALLLTDRYPDVDPLAALGDLARPRQGPIQVSGEDDLRRSRLTVLFRLPLAFPHLLWLGLWSLLVLPAALLNWLATLAGGRSPYWLHRFLAAYVRYQLHVWSFLYLVANPFPGFSGSAGSYPASEVLLAERSVQNRWKTAFRAILALPAFALSGAYGSLAAVVALLGWFVSLALGRVPRGFRNAGALALGYQAQMLGYGLLLTDVYPYSGPMRPPGEDAVPAPAPESPQAGLGLA